MAHMIVNISTDKIVFTAAEISELNAAAAAIEVRGARLPDAALAFSDVESPRRR